MTSNEILWWQLVACAAIVGVLLLFRVVWSLQRQLEEAKSTMHFTLYDRAPDGGHNRYSVTGRVTVVGSNSPGEGQFLYISVDGYSEPEANDDDGEVVFMEFWNGELWLQCCDDINAPAPNRMSLEGARVINRKPEEKEQQ